VVDLTEVKPRCWQTKRLILVALTVLLLTGGCAKKKAGTNKALTIGITQIISHPGIDAVREGFLDGMKAAGYTKEAGTKYDFQNAQGDMSNAQKIAQKFVSDQVDLIFAISTPSTQAAAKATKTIPIVFGAVTDPVSAGVVRSIRSPGGNVTGVSDVWPYKDQIALLLKISPDVKRLGVVYNPGESNSAFAMERIKQACKELGLKLVTAPVSGTGEVYAVAKSLVGRVDAFYSSADNTVISAVESLVKVAQEARIPCIAGESDSVQRGALATLGTNYYEVGRSSAKLATKVLGGIDPGLIPVVEETKTDLYINLKAAKAMGVSVPQDLVKKAKKIYR